MDTKTLLEKIYLDSIDSVDGELKENKIIWNDIYGTENCVYDSDVAQQDEIYAWYETNDSGIDKVKIKLKNNIIAEWRPPINSMGFSYGSCKFFKIYDFFLIVAYSDKHTDKLNYINLNNFEVKEIKLDGYRKNFKMNNNEVIVEESYSKNKGAKFKIIISNSEIIKETIEE